MMKISENFEPSENVITLNVSTNLLNKYYPNLYGMIVKNKELPAGTKIEKLSSTEAMISFPVPENSTFEKIDETRGRIGIDSKIINKYFKLISNFSNLALRREFKHTEFLPIGNDYKLSDLQNDVKEAIKAKRNFVILHSFKDYKEGKKPGEVKYDQVFVSYENDPSDYADVALMIISGNLKELRKWAAPKFKITEWI